VIGTLRALIAGAIVAVALAVVTVAVAMAATPRSDAGQPRPAPAAPPAVPDASQDPALTPAATPTPPPPPPTVAIRQVAVSYDAASNKETVAVDLVASNATAPFRYEVAVRGAAVATGSSTTSPVTLALLDNCSITTQSVTVAITDATGATAAAAATLDHSLCPPPPAVPHARDRILAGPTLTRASFVDHLRAMGSPALREGGPIYDTLIAGGVNPAFALGTFQAESHSGTRGHAVVTRNWGNILFRPWTVTFGATPYAPGNGYTYAKFPSWLASIRAYTDLVRRYHASGYVTVSQASAHWLGTTEGSTRHLTYLGNITRAMALLPDDAVPVMVTLTAPARARATFTVTFRARDNLLVTGYQVRVRPIAGSWLPSASQAGGTRSITLGNGTWVIGVRATDGAGNWSRWRYATVRVDASAPEMRTLVAPHLLLSANGVLHVTWSARDNLAVTGYEVRTRQGAAGAWSASIATRTPSLSKRLGPGTWTVAVRARDAVGNRSPWREALVIVPVDDRAYHFSASTSLATDTHYYRGTLSRTAARGSTMTIPFTGSWLYLVGTIGPSYGRMSITIDGETTTIDTGTWKGGRATTNHHRAVLLSAALAPGDHVAVITNLRTPGRPWIGIDALGISE